MADQVIRDADTRDEHRGARDADSRSHGVDAVRREQLILMVLKVEPQEARDRNHATQKVRQLRERMQRGCCVCVIRDREEEIGGEDERNGKRDADTARGG